MTKGKKVCLSVVALAATVLLILLDQYTKSLAVAILKPNGPWVIIDGIFELQYLENNGAAFGMFQNMQWVFVIMAVVILGFAVYCFFRMPFTKRFTYLRILCVTICAGAIGNVIDRVTRGFVVDFFYFSLIDFPIFNVADIYITVSFVILMLLIFFYYKEEDFLFLNKNK